jgi:hypothetical protein
MECRKSEVSIIVKKSGNADGAKGNRLKSFSYNIMNLNMGLT